MFPRRGLGSQPGLEHLRKPGWTVWGGDSDQPQAGHTLSCLLEEGLCGVLSTGQLVYNTRRERLVWAAAGNARLPLQRCRWLPKGPRCEWSSGGDNGNGTRLGVAETPVRCGCCFQRRPGAAGQPSVRGRSYRTK